ncbi:MAG TPA: Fe-Mn family superoxide dismutase [Planctomycetota bacterium]|nr:Fe-Mn family superoxide dismutase [Planctomycetota bacterium]
MAHVAKDFSHLKGSLKGFSDKQLDAHFTLYNGYVTKLNEIEEKLKTADRSKANYTFADYSELKRRECTAFNGTYLHQLYFENLSGTGGEASAGLRKAVDAGFGSWDAYIADLKGSAGSTPGWVLTTRNRVDGHLHNYVMYEHHIGLPAHQDILLALDCWEHAFFIDFGVKKADYLAAFLQNANWDEVNKRFAALK